MKCEMVVVEKHSPAGKTVLHKLCGVCGWKKVEEFHRPEQVFEKPTECAAQAKAHFDGETADFVSTVLASAQPAPVCAVGRDLPLGKGNAPVMADNAPTGATTPPVRRRGSFPPPCADITLRIRYVDMNTATGNRHA